MILAVDTETTGLDFLHGCRPWLVTMCDGTSNYYWSAPVSKDRSVSWKQNDIECIKDMLDRAKTIVFHNAEFDIRALQSIGIDYKPYYHKTEDTMTAYHIIDSSSSKKSLKYLTVKYLMIPDDDEHELKLQVVEASKETDIQVAKKGHPTTPAIKSSWKQNMFLCFDLALTYALRDVERTWLLWKFIRKELVYYDMLKVYRRKMQTLPALMSLYTRGINVYSNRLEKVIDELNQENIKIVHKIKELANVNWVPNLKSKTDLHTLFHVHLKLPIIFTKTGEFCFDKNALAIYSQHNHPIIHYFVKWNDNYTKINYLEQYLHWSKDGRIHPIYEMCGTKQTRQASKNPNGQNIGKNLREYFGPPPGKVWLDVDCVNIELRIWAYSVGNSDLIERFERGESVHALITKTVYPEYENKTESEIKQLPEYDLCKAGNFARIYGAGDDKANSTYGKSNAVDLIDQKFPEIGAFMKKCIRQAEQNMETFWEPCIFTLTGSKVNVPEEQMYKAVNAFIQGTAGDVMAEMMIDCEKANYPMFQQVHDSLKFELEESELDLVPEILNTMQKAGERIIPTCHLDYKIVEHFND